MEKITITPRPKPMFREVPFFVDLKNALNTDISSLAGHGPVVGRLHFEIDGESKIGILAVDLDTGKLWVECPGIGVVMVTFGDIGHQMSHFLCKDDDLCEFDRKQRK